MKRRCNALLAALALAVPHGLGRRRAGCRARRCRPTRRSVAAATWPLRPACCPRLHGSAIMNGLGKHYGTDASLDAASAQKIGAWLQANAGTYKRVREEPPQDRMTQSNWFLRKHREVAPDVFRRASIKSAANCTACHGGADQGNFSEHAVRIPK